ncbi:MAG TPA: response regulator [Terriglobia bacterium]
MSKRILIIDDEEDIRDVAQISLEEMAGWHTLPAVSGADGVTCAQVELPDAILLDVMMPDMDGTTVLARLKEDRRTAGIPVILLTAKVQVARRPPFGGAAGVILKPFDPFDLAGQVARLLGWNLPVPGTES